MSHKPDNLFLGVVFILIASIAYACMGVVVKFGGTYSDTQLVFSRNFVCLLVLFPWILIPKPKLLKTQVIGTHIFRSMAGLCNMYCFFYSIHFILLSDAMVLNNTMPLFIPLVVWIWKGTKIPVQLIPGLLIGFLGVIFILQPGAGIFCPQALFALASGIFMSLSMAGIRELGRHEPTYRIMFYYFALSSLASFFPMLFTLKFPQLDNFLILIGVGIFAALYQYFLTLGYNYASATKISPIIYFSVILSVFFDWFFWKAEPKWPSLIGILLVIAGAIWTLRAKPFKRN